MPDWKTEIRTRLAGLNLDAAREAEIVEEISQHLDDRFMELHAKGATQEAASRTALDELTGGELLAAELRRVERPERREPLVFRGTRRNMLEEFLGDLKYAARRLRKNPGFTAVFLLTLAVGMGAVSAVFSIVHGVLLTSPPYPKPEQIVLISPVNTTGEPYAQGSAAGQWQEWRKEAKSFSAMAGYNWGREFLVLSDRSEPVSGLFVSSDFFKVLGVQPQMGRVFLPSEFPALWSGAAPGVVILGHDLWQRQFHGDPNILGRVIRFNNNAGEPNLDTVIGVMPPGLRVLPSPSMSHMPGYDANGQVEFWMPASGPKILGPKSTYWSVAGRLRDGAGLAAAQAELTAIAARQGQADHAFEGITAKAESLITDMNEPARRLLVPLVGAVTLVFLIVCGSVAGLLLARGLHRQGDYAVRCALGAGRWRLFRHSLAESLLLALLGGVLGAALAVAAVKWLKATAGAAIPRLDAVTLGWPVPASCFAAALLVATIAGLAPAFRISRLKPMGANWGGTRTSANRADRRLLGGVAMAQTALTLALLVGAGLLIRTVANLAQIRPGYDTERIASMTVTEMRPGQTTDAVWGRHLTDFNRRALAQVSALPGVRSAAWSWGIPLTGNEFLAAIQTGGGGNLEKFKDEVDVPVRTVSPEYFDTVGLSLLAGRNFGAADNSTNEVNSVIINQAMARQYFRNIDPVGKTFRMILVYSGIKIYRSFVEARIIGVVADSRDATLTRKSEPEFYLSFWQIPTLFRSLVVRTTGDSRSVIAGVQRALRAVDPEVAVEDVKTFEQIRNASIAPQLFTMRLLTGFSILAGALALIGVSGVLSLSVASRHKEMAIRMAVGAPRRSILGLMLREGLNLVGIGVVVGICVALASTGILGTLLFGVEPTDPLTFVTVALLFMAAAAVSCYFPARRATQIDPMEALRAE
jgi:putative ABC transport system permease protein